MNGCILIWHRELLLTINWMGEKLNLLIRYYRSSTVVVSTARHHCNDPWVRVGLGDHRAGLSQTCQSKINRNINKYSIWHLCFFTINNASPVSCRKTTRARWIRLYLEHLSKKVYKLALRYFGQMRFLDPHLFPHPGRLICPTVKLLISLVLPILQIISCLLFSISYPFWSFPLWSAFTSFCLLVPPFSFAFVPVFLVWSCLIQRFKILPQLKDFFPQLSRFASAVSFLMMRRFSKAWIVLFFGWPPSWS